MRTVIGAATALADDAGLVAVRTRRVAQQLEVSAMTPHAYVPGKAGLVDLMLDATNQRLPLANTTGQPRRQRLTVIAEENRALHLRHPWASAVSTLRPPLGSGLMATYEHELSGLIDGRG